MMTVGSCDEIIKRDWSVEVPRLDRHSIDLDSSQGLDHVICTFCGENL